MSLFQEEFVAVSAAVRVRFGAGVRHAVGEEMDALGVRRALVLTTPQQAGTAAEFAAMLGDTGGRHIHAARRCTRRSRSPRRRPAVARALGADCVVAVGGGSTTASARPSRCAPTCRRSSCRRPMPDPRRRRSSARPKAGGRRRSHAEGAAGGDPLRRRAGAHAARADDRDQRAERHGPCGGGAVRPQPLPDFDADGGRGPARLPRRAAPRGRRTRTISGRAARRSTAPGCAARCWGRSAWRCTTSSATRWAASFDLPHAETHASSCRTPSPTTSSAVRPSRAHRGDLRGADGRRRAARFAVAMKAPLALRDLGLQEDDLDRAAALATENPYWNPRPVERDAHCDACCRPHGPESHRRPDTQRDTGGTTTHGRHHDRGADHRNRAVRLGRRRAALDATASRTWW